MLEKHRRALPVTDAEKIADALRAAPQFITAGATIVDYPAGKGDEWRVFRPMQETDKQ